jgi:hypothetical protein
MLDHFMLPFHEAMDAGPFHAAFPGSGKGVFSRHDQAVNPPVETVCEQAPADRDEIVPTTLRKSTRRRA